MQKLEFPDQTSPPINTYEGTIFVNISNWKGMSYERKLRPTYNSLTTLHKFITSLRHVRDHYNCRYSPTQTNLQKQCKNAPLRYEFVAQFVNMTDFFLSYLTSILNNILLAKTV